MIRTFKRAAVFDRKHEWKQKPAQKAPSIGERKAEWTRRRRELARACEKEARAIKARLESRTHAALAAWVR